MKTYHIIDKENRNTDLELKHYTFEQLKKYFEPDKEEFPDSYEEWEKIEDLFDLEEFLEHEAGGMAQNFVFEEDEVKDLETMNKANKFYNKFF